MDDITPNRNNPAVNLASDLLLTIFEFDRVLPLTLDICHSLASNQINWDALHQLRYKSQTCSAWRALTLNSPLLWARAVVLNSFFQRNRDGSRVHTNAGNSDANPSIQKQDSGPILWMKEVIRRTQTSPLWVVGSFYRPEFAQLTVSHIKQEWHRIERIIIRLDRGQVYPEFEDIITRPAPFLQKCCFEFNEGQISKTPPSGVFANHAPFLTTLTVRNFWINHNVSFLSGLRHLVIELPISLSQTLDILDKTPLLNSLKIQSENDHQGGELPYVHLPYLAYIDPPMLIPFSLALLEHIRPSPGCSLSLTLRGRPPNELTIEQVNPVVVFAKGFLLHHSPRRIELYVINRTSFRIMFNSGNEEGPEFWVAYSDLWTRENPMSIVVVSLIKAFSVPEIACAKEFRFETRGDSETPDVVADVVVNTFAPLILPGLEVFIVEQDILSAFFEPYLDRSSVPIADIFPRLRTIVIKGVGSHDIHGSETLKDVLSRLLAKIY